jgi:hypothetical protein
MRYGRIIVNDKLVEEADVVCLKVLEGLRKTAVKVRTASSLLGL